ncbi:MAG TPA: hypothetical protein VJI75_03985 [Candidatus Nanoarchaeia archaeon]|nr:hypothetical protein [Candidatus Nanoarchaeia archaeon]
MTKETHHEHAAHHRLFFENASFPFLALILFAGIYFLSAQFLLSPATDIRNSQILEIFSDYHKFFGIGMALITLIGTYILYGIFAAVTLMRFAVMKPLLLFLGYAPWAAFGFQLMFREVGRVDITRAIIHYAGLPLLVSGSLLSLLAIAWMIICFRRLA